MEIQRKITAGTWQMKKKQMKKYRSPIWEYIFEVFDGANKIENAFYCTLCNKALYNTYEKGNTMLFTRHVCRTNDSVNNKTKLLIRPEHKSEFKTAAANFIAKDLRPYMAVEGEGLMDLCFASMKFGQQYKTASIDDLCAVMPSRNTVRSHLEKTANRIKSKIKKILQNAKEVGGFAITSDTWTDKYRRLTYICLVAHCNIITEKGIVRHKFTLYVNQITELVKSKEVIVNYILSVLKDYGFNEEDVRQFITFVTDRGSNFKYGLISNGYDRHNCYAHLIHNLVKNMFKSDRVKQMKNSAAKITAFVKNSNLNSQLPKSMKSFSASRWNGAFTMLQSLAENFHQLSDLLYHRQRQNQKQKYFDVLSSIKLEEVSAVCNFLKQFKQITDQIEGDKYETLSMVWPIFTQLNVMFQRDVLAEDDDNLSIVEEMKSDGLAYLTTRHNDFKPSIKQKIATVLNPLFKKLPAVSEHERREVYEKINGMICHSDPEEANSSCVEESETKIIVLKQSQNEVPTIHPFFRSFYSIDEEEKSQQLSELERYLDHRIVSANMDITDWWNEQRNEYPKLFRLFAKLSAIPASSASGERVFSKTGLVITDRRNLILPENVNNIIIAGNIINEM